MSTVGKRNTNIKVIKQSASRIEPFSVSSGGERELGLAETFPFAPFGAEHDEHVSELLSNVSDFLGIERSLYAKYPEVNMNEVWAVMLYVHMLSPLYSALSPVQQRVADFLLKEGLLDYFQDDEIGPKLVVTDENLVFCFPLTDMSPDSFFKYFDPVNESWDNASLSHDKDGLFIDSKTSRFIDGEFSGISFIDPDVPFIKDAKRKIDSVYLKTSKVNARLFSSVFKNHNVEKSTTFFIKKFKKIIEAGKRANTPISFTVKSYRYSLNIDMWEKAHSALGMVRTARGSYFIKVPVHLVENSYKLYGKGISFRFDEDQLLKINSDDLLLQENQYNQFMGIDTPISIFNKKNELCGVIFGETIGDVFHKSGNSKKNVSLPPNINSVPLKNLVTLFNEREKIRKQFQNK